MSKEVKLGLAIGGILLSVILVFMMAMSGKPASDGQVVLELPSPPDQASGPTPPPALPGALARLETPVGPVPAAEVPATQPAGSTSVAAAEPRLRDDPWIGLLATGEFEQTTTPIPAPPLVPDVKPAVVPVEIPEPAPAAESQDRPVSSVARTHQVQRGETFSSISAAAYGSSAYFAHIIRANPGIDPNKLRPGMIINLPPESQVRATSTPRADQNRALDQRTEYRVQGNDSLYKIAMKLYGKPEFVDRIYDANKAAIGADKAKLRVGMILRLPEAPVVSR